MKHILVDIDKDSEVWLPGTTKSQAKIDNSNNSNS
jgi:hypothetical protein